MPRSWKPQQGGALEAQGHLEALAPARALAIQVAGAVSDWPWVGTSAREVEPLFAFLEAGLGAAGEATELGALLQSILDDPSPGQRLSFELPALGARVDALSGRLVDAQAARDRLALQEWPFQDLQPVLALWDESIPEATRVLAQADEALRVAPVLLGTERPFRWLIMGQNNDELRATGGFLSMVGSVVIEDGKPGPAELEKVYLAEGMTQTGDEADLPGTVLAPPVPFSRYMGLDRWLLRDANWFADFPTSAWWTAWFWEALKGKEVDGVLAFNERGLEAVLDAVGPLTLADGTRVGADNVKDLLLVGGFEGTSAPEWWTSQSAVSTQYGAALVERVSGLGLEEMERVFTALQPAFARGDILVTSPDPTLSPILRRLGVDGALDPGTDDFLYFVEQNVSFSKASQSIRHQLRYDGVLLPSGASVSARVTLVARNDFTEADRLPGYPASYYRGIRVDREAGVVTTAEGYYGGFSELFLPATAEVLSIVGFDDGPFVSRESGLVVVAGYCGMMPGDDCRAEVTYRPRVDPSVPGRFLLLVPVQPGAPDREVIVSVSLPEGWSAADVAGPGRVTVDERTVTWTAIPDKDATFSLQLVPRSS